MYIVFPPSHVAVSSNVWCPRRSVKKILEICVAGSVSISELKVVLMQKSPEQFLASPMAYPAPTMAANCLWLKPMTAM